MLTDGLGRIDARIAVNTFLIRADRIGGVEGLQFGMMVWLHQQ
jgi:hypothetical protein